MNNDQLSMSNEQKSMNKYQWLVINRQLSMINKNSIFKVQDSRLLMQAVWL
jgi:hypothetical protein